MYTPLCPLRWLPNDFNKSEVWNWRVFSCFCEGAILWPGVTYYVVTVGMVGISHCYHNTSFNFHTQETTTDRIGLMKAISYLGNKTWILPQMPWMVECNSGAGGTDLHGRVLQKCEGGIHDHWGIPTSRSIESLSFILCLILHPWP